MQRTRISSNGNEDFNHPSGALRGKRYEPDQAVALLRKIDAAIAGGASLENACRAVGIVEHTYYRWSKQYGGLGEEQAKRLKALEEENARLRRIVSELSLEKLVLKDLVSKKL